MQCLDILERVWFGAGSFDFTVEEDFAWFILPDELIVRSLITTRNDLAQKRVKRTDHHLFCILGVVFKHKRIALVSLSPYRKRN
jgi:hypothetical protein